MKNLDFKEFIAKNLNDKKINFKFDGLNEVWDNWFYR